MIQFLVCLFPNKVLPCYWTETRLHSCRSFDCEKVYPKVDSPNLVCACASQYLHFLSRVPWQRSLLWLEAVQDIHFSLQSQPGSADIAAIGLNMTENCSTSGDLQSNPIVHNIEVESLITAADDNS